MFLNLRRNSYRENRSVKFSKVPVKLYSTDYRPHLPAVPCFVQVAETNRPHCYFDIQVGRTRNQKRVVIKLRPDKAPFMCDNFV